MLQRSNITVQNRPVEAARRSVAVVLVAITALAIGLLFFVSLTYFKSDDLEAAQSRLLLYQRSLNETLERYQHLPFVLARDPLVSDVLTGKSSDLLNRRLKSFAHEAKLEAIYLMDETGLVLASSNFDEQHSFVGQNYGFRPYFKQALSGSRGNYFGIGATTGRPGYFVSEPVTDGSEDIRGVIAIKLDASELQQTWERGAENVLASNSDGIVVLASNRSWLYGSIRPLLPDRLEAIRQSKQFGAEEITDLSWIEADRNSVELDGRMYTYAGEGADFLDWKVHYLLGEGRAYERALLTTIIFGSAISLLVGFATYLRSKRIQAALRTSQSDRDQLLQANRQLEDAHLELAKTSKLAALGQLSASVVHELGQPISALRNYLTALEISNGDTSKSILAKLSSVVDRMENITRQLKFFTKPGDQKLEVVNLGDVIAGALELLVHDIKRDNVKVELQSDFPQVSILGNKLRLEQVLVNLLRNSLASLREASGDCIKISITHLNGQAVLAVEDNGAGFGKRELSQLQEPFHTTRASGDGMGLGLSISTEIIKEHDGSLTAQNVPGGGAKFSVHLPVISGTDVVPR